MQKKWVMATTAATLSFGVLGAAAAYAATTSHLSDQEGTSIAAGVEGTSDGEVRESGDLSGIGAPVQHGLGAEPAVVAPTPTTAAEPGSAPGRHDEPGGGSGAEARQPSQPAPAPAPPPQSIDSPESYSAPSADSAD